MDPTRPHWQDLEAVADGDLIFRFVHPRDYKQMLPSGARVQPSALSTDEFKPNAKSYGASVYARSKLPRGIDDLYEACSKWTQWHYAQVPVSEVVALGVEVRLSPQDCEFDLVRHAHASLLNVTRPIRIQLIRIIEAHLSLVTETK
jgi:hypothetical protein